MEADMISLLKKRNKPHLSPKWTDLFPAWARRFQIFWFFVSERQGNTVYKSQ